MSPQPQPEKSRGSSDTRIPEMMNAARLHLPGGPEGIVCERVPTPQPKAGEVLVRVAAAAITRDELTWPTNRLPAIPSYEFSGVVAATAPDVRGIAVGETVYALSLFDRDGAAAEYLSLPHGLLSPKPKTLGFIESAAIPLAALSAWQGLFTHGHLEKGQRVLIQGAAGGVGNFAVQLARQGGAQVIGTTSTPNVDTVRGLGADEVIDYRATHFEEVVHDVDLVFDTVGGDTLAHSTAVVRPGGRLVSVASEPSLEQATARGITALYFVVAPDREQLAKITHLVDSGDLHPKISAVITLDNAREAFALCQNRHGAGKIVLQVEK